MRIYPRCRRLQNCIDPFEAIVTSSRDILIIPFFVRARACNAEEIKGLPVAPVLYPRLVIQRDCARGLENPMNSLFPCLRFSDVLSLSLSFTLSLSPCLSSLSLTFSFPFALFLSFPLHRSSQLYARAQLDQALLWLREIVFLSPYFVAPVRRSLD